MSQMLSTFTALKTCIFLFKSLGLDLWQSIEILSPMVREILQSIGSFLCKQLTQVWSPALYMVITLLLTKYIYIMNSCLHYAFETEKSTSEWVLFWFCCGAELKFLKPAFAIFFTTLLQVGVIPRPHKRSHVRTFLLD